MNEKPDWMNEPNWSHHAFCDAVRNLDVGGQAYRDWQCCIYADGALIGYRNHVWFILFSSDPSARCLRASGQNSRVYGDTSPRLDAGACWITFKELPIEASGRAEAAVKKAKQIAIDAIARLHAEREMKDHERSVDHENEREKIKLAWSSEA